MPASVHDLIESPVNKDSHKTENVKLTVAYDNVRTIHLTVNGIGYTVSNADPKMLLNDWLRNHLHLKGKVFQKIGIS